MKPTFKILAPASACLLAGLTILQISQTNALAVATTIADGNSSITFDPTSASGINNWTVDGCNQLNQEAFFFRLGNSGPAVSITTIGAPTISQTANSLTTTYANSQVSIQLIYTLTGGAPGSFGSSLGVQFGVQNFTTGSTLSLYDYADFSIGGSPNTATLGKNLQDQFNEALVTGANGASVETSFSRGATAAEAALFDSTLTKLAAGTALSGDASAGPGEATWALQWDFNPGQSATFSSASVLQSVPEPPDRLLPWVGLGACLLMIRFAPRLNYRLAHTKAPGSSR